MQSKEFTELSLLLKEIKEDVEVIKQALSTTETTYDVQPALPTLREYAGEEELRVTCPDEAYQLFRRMRLLEVEEVWVALLNSKHVVIDLRMVFRGTIDQALVNPRDILRLALRKRAVKVIFAHNHPSGDAQPSGMDVQVTKQIVKAGNIVGVPVMDHLVIGSDGYFVSMKEAGILDSPKKQYTVAGGRESRSQTPSL